MENVQPGAYLVMAEKPPLANGFHPESRPSEPERLLQVEGRPIEGLQIFLAPGAVITGKVSDPFGRPAVNADVSVRQVGPPALRRPNSRGHGEFVTDETGHFRIFGLGSGDYLLSAKGQMYVEARLGSTEGKPITYARVFFPDVLDPADAQILTLSPGQERTGLDFRLRLTTLSQINGVVTGPQEALGGFSILRLEPFRPEVAEALSQPIFASAHGGTFRVQRVAPGRYWLTARVEVAGKAGQTPLWFWAAAEVVVGEQDVSDVVLLFQPPSSVSGRVTVMSADGTTAAQLGSRVEVVLVPTIGTPAIDRLASAIDSAGGFRIGKVPAGQYQIVVRDLTTQQEHAVVSVSTSGATTTGRVLQVPSGDLKDVTVAVR